MAKRGRPRRVTFSVGLGRGSTVKTGETDEVQETDRVPISGSDGVFLNSDELHASIDEGWGHKPASCSSGGNPVHRPSVAWMKKSQGSSGPSHLGASVSSCQPSCSLQMPVDGQGYNLRPNRQNNWQIVERKKKGKQKEGVGDSTSDCALIKPQCPPMHDDVDGQGRFRPAATPPVDNGDDDPRCLERQRPQ
ncbi:hypothetical protein Dimus_001944 [Dionaea muscipula]